MHYFVSEKDTNGFIHSVDNLILEYTFKSTTYETVRRFIPKLRELKQKYPDTDYYEKLDLNASRKYYFAQDYVHLDEGIALFFGKQVEKLDTPVKASGTKFFILPLMKLKINPNKHAGKPILTELLGLLQENECEVRLCQYDYAVDIPLKPEDVQVFSTRKQKGLFKGTRYYGQRDKNGFTRIYDKQKEQGLDSPLTRVETVISLTKATKKVSFEKVYYRCRKEQGTQEKLTKTDRALIELCELLRCNGLDYQEGLNLLDGRKRRFIEEQLGNGGYARLKLDEELLKRLLKQVMEKFDVMEMPETGITDDVETDGDGFCIIPENMELPFD